MPRRLGRRSLSIMAGRAGGKFGGGRGFPRRSSAIDSKERPAMSAAHDFYTERAAQARRDADTALLANVRERWLCAAAAWEVMAARAARTGRLRAETEARKTAEAEAGLAILCP